LLSPRAQLRRAPDVAGVQGTVRCERLYFGRAERIEDVHAYQARCREQRLRSRAGEERKSVVFSNTLELMTQIAERWNPRSALLHSWLIQAFFWCVTLIQTQRHHLSPWIIGFDAVLLAMFVPNLVFMARAGVGLPTLGITLLSAVSLTLANFSWFYWENGGRENFTSVLSHLDSVYFALGTLSTAGTGTLSAVSETARGIQAAQMAVDIGLTLFAVGVVVSRFTAPFGKRLPARPSSHASESPPPESSGLGEKVPPHGAGQQASEGDGALVDDTSPEDEDHLQ